MAHGNTININNGLYELQKKIQETMNEDSKFEISFAMTVTRDVAHVRIKVDNYTLSRLGLPVQLMNLFVRDVDAAVPDILMRIRDAISRSPQSEQHRVQDGDKG